MKRLSIVSACWPALLCCLFLAGCIQLERPYPQKKSYVLEARRKGDSRTAPSGAILLVRNFGSTARYRGKGFVYRLDDLRYQADFYHQFFTAPAAMIAEESGLWLQQAGLFSHLTEGGTPPPTHVLRGKIGALYGDFRPGRPAAAVLELQLALTDDRSVSPQILLDRKYRREIPLTDRSPEGLLRGWNTSLQEILAEFESDLQQVMKPPESSDPASPSRGPVGMKQADPCSPPLPTAPESDTVLFPDGELFEAPLANPKEPRFHITWLNIDLDAGTFDVASVGFGESFGLVCWGGPGPADEWQFGLSGAVFAQFNLDSDSMDLVNADYIIGLPLSYRHGPWSARFRLYHQSSHLGDEFLLYPQAIGPVERINLSFETAEFLAAWEWRGLRISGGPSYIIHTDTPLRRHSVQGSLDYISPSLPRVPGNLFGSLFVNLWEENDWDVSLNLKAGLNLKSPYTGKRSLQFFAEYFNGHLPFGQFYQETADYFGVGVSLGL